MKINTTTRIGLGVLAALCLQISGNLYGQVYVDDFSSNSGALSGRTTASGFGNWTADSAFQVGSDKITINSNASVNYHRASFSLPTLTTNDTLSLSITLRPSGSLFTAFGFTSSSGEYVSNTGYSWMYFTGLGNPYPRIEVLTGPGNAGVIYNASLINPALGFDASLPTIFQYTYSAVAKTLSLSAMNGSSSSTLLNQMDVSKIPLEAFLWMLGGSYELRLDARGTHLDGYIDGQLLFAVEDE